MLKEKEISILISYDQQIIADGLAAIFSNEKGLHVTDLIKNESSLIENLVNTNADILIMELCDISIKRIKFINLIHKSAPSLKLLIISELITREMLETLMPVINGYMIRTCSSEKVILAIHEILETGKYLCSQVIDVLFDNNHENSEEIQLTTREKELLVLWLTSKDASQIARKLNISQTTVRTHLKNIRSKFGHTNQIQMMIYACKQNLLSDDLFSLCPNCRSFCNHV